MNAIAPHLNNLNVRKYGYGKKGNMRPAKAKINMEFDLNSAKEPDNRKIFFRYIKKYDFDIAYIKLKKNIQNKNLRVEIIKDIKNFRLRRMSRKILFLLRNK